MIGKRERFLRSVEMLCDHWPLERAATTMRAAMRYEEERLPENTGIAALQFVCGVTPIKVLGGDQSVR